MNAESKSPSPWEPEPNPRSESRFEESRLEPGRDAELEARVDLTLRRLFEPPGLEAVIARVAAHARPRPWLSLPRTLAAACVLVALLVLWLVALTARENRSALPDQSTAVAAHWQKSFEDALQHGFGSPDCCAGPIALRELCTQLFQCKLDLRSSPAIELCGTYCGRYCDPGAAAADAASQRGFAAPAGAPATTTLLMRCQGTPVCVFVLPLAHDPRPDERALQGVHLRRRELPPLVLYELRCNPRASVLDAFWVAPD